MNDSKQRQEIPEDACDLIDQEALDDLQDINLSIDRLTEVIQDLEIREPKFAEWIRVIARRHTAVIEKSMKTKGAAKAAETLAIKFVAMTYHVMGISIRVNEVSQLERSFDLEASDETDNT